MSFLLIVHDNIKITEVLPFIIIHDFTSKQQKRNTNEGSNFWIKLTSSRNDLSMYTNKAGMNPQQDYPASHRKISVKKDWKTTLLLLPDYATDVE